MHETSTFYGIFDPEEFHLLNEDDKLKWALENKVYIREKHNLNSLSTSQALDYYRTHPWVFGVSKYDSNYYYDWNPIFIEDLYNELKAYPLSDKEFEVTKKSIKYELDFCLNDDEKKNYLRDKLKIYNPLQCSNLNPEYNSISNKWEVDYEQKRAIVLKFDLFYESFLEGDIDAISMELAFGEDYFEDILTLELNSYCLELFAANNISSDELNNQSDNPRSEMNAFKFTYLLFKLDVINQLEDTYGLKSDLKLAEIITQVYKVNSRTITRHLETLNSKKPLGPNQQKSVEQINKLLDFKK